MSFLEVNHVFVSDSEKEILRDITFTQSKREHIVVAGETGSGKSTLLKVIAGLAHADSGQVLFEGMRVPGPLEKLVPGHSEIAYLSQHFELPKFLRVEQVLEYSNSIDPDFANRLYELCQIEHLLKRKTDQLSGGERQRIAMARLLTGSPKLLLLDEPFSNLDMGHKQTLKEVVGDIVLDLDITFILVSHDPSDTLPWADKIAVLRSGQMIQFDSPLEIYRNPVNEYVAGLFGRHCILTDEFLQVIALQNGNGDRKYFRPEDFVLSHEGNKASFTGTVVSYLFFGGRYEIKIHVGDNVIYMYAEQPIEKGKQVSVQIRD